MRKIFYRLNILSGSRIDIYSWVKVTARIRVKKKKKEKKFKEI